MDKNSFMWLPVGTLESEIYNHERIRDNHAKNKDKKNTDYLNRRIGKYKEAIEILKEAETSNEKALNIGDVSGSLVNDIKDRKKRHMIALKKYKNGSEESINLKSRISECQQIISIINDR